MPPFLARCPKSPAPHGAGEELPVAALIGADTSGVAMRQSPEEIERRAHVDLGAVASRHQGEVHGRATRVAGARRQVPERKQRSLVDIRVELALALEVAGIAR